MPYRQTKNRNKGALLKYGRELCGKIYEANEAHSKLVVQVVTNMSDITGLLNRIEALEMKVKEQKKKGR